MAAPLNSKGASGYPFIYSHDLYLQSCSQGTPFDSDIAKMESLLKGHLDSGKPDVAHVVQIVHKLDLLYTDRAQWKAYQNPFIFYVHPPYAYSPVPEIHKEPQPERKLLPAPEEDRPIDYTTTLQQLSESEEREV